MTPEFKAEAVRQVIKPGYSVAEIAARLGVSTQSLYKWVKAITPDKSEKQASELLEARARFCGCERRFCAWKKSGTS
ncbi:TPA: transposase [Pseudomonas aeruginosa]|nr:transposase [Pseudomonas aeruginosa]